MVDNRHYRNLVYDFDVPGTLMLHADAVIMERLFECQGRGTPDEGKYHFNINLENPKEW